MSIERRNRIRGQFAARLVEMLESPANRVLSLSAKRVLERVEIELAHHGGKDNGRLPVTYDDFHAFGIHRHSIAGAIRECVALGFLEVTEQGRAGNAEYRTPNRFRLTYKPTKGFIGDGTHEWRKIVDPADAERIAKAARRKTESQCRKMPVSSADNRHRKRRSAVPETVTTSHSAESITTIDISGRGRDSNTNAEAGQPRRRRMATRL
jgi:hypothetical protein